MRTDDVNALIREVTDRLILPRFRHLAPDEVIQKHPGDLVTVADREAEVALTQALQRATPDAVIVGEEATFADPTTLTRLNGADHAWVIDPVDGTRNFAHGSEDFGVMLAEVRGGQTVRGWIWQPRHDQFFEVERGSGATCNGEPLSPVRPHDAPWTAAVWGTLESAHDPRLQMRRTRGACAIDYPALARGEVDALAYRSIHPWDHLAGALLVTELGGVSRVDGRPYGPGVTGALIVTASSEQAAQAVEDLART